MENWAETLMLSWSPQWGKSIFFISPSIKKRKLSTMLCRRFHHVPPWTVINSAPAVPSRWGSGGLQSFPARCEGPHQPPAPLMPYQALLADAGSHDLSNPWWGAQCPPEWLPPLASHARSCLLCWPGAWSGLFCALTDVPRMRPSRALVWWLGSSMCLVHSQLLGQGSGSWRDPWDALQTVWAGILHLQSRLSVLSPRSLSLCCYHKYNNKQRKQASWISIRGSEISKLI